MVSVSDETSSLTLQRTDEIARQEKLSLAAENPLVKRVLETFPGAKVTDVIEPIEIGDQLPSTLLAGTNLTENSESVFLLKHSDKAEHLAKEEKIYDA